MKNNIYSRISKLCVFCSIGLVVFSCEKQLDYSTSWIEYYRYEDALDATKTLIIDDTIFASLNEEFLISLRTQSNNGGTPIILKKIDNGDFVDFSTTSSEAALRGEAEQDGGLRQIYEIPINLYESIFSRGQIIHYRTTIGSFNGEITDELFIKIE